MKASDPHHRTTTPATYVPAAIAAVATFLVYLPSLRNDFLAWDDTTYVTQNGLLRSLDVNFIRSAFLEFHASNWHPLTWISHALDYAIWGLDPVGHHLTNVLLHSLNTALVVVATIRLLALYRATHRTTNPPAWLGERAAMIAGGCTGLLFGLHPIHVESVAWVAERKDLLCALFFLLSVRSYVTFVHQLREPPSPGAPRSSRPNASYLLSLCFFALALMSKPMAVSLPVVLLIIDWYPGATIHSVRSFCRALLCKLPFAALAAASSVLTILAQRAGGATDLLEPVPLPARILIAVRSLAVYLLELALPVPLSPFYPYPDHVSLSAPGFVAPLVLVSAISLGALLVVRRHKVFAATWGYFVVTLLPVLGIVQVGFQSMANRYAYLPSVGPFLLGGLLAARCSGKVGVPGRAPAAAVRNLVAAALLFTALGWLTVKQIGIWRNDFALWNHAVQVNPSDLAYYSRGLASRRAGLPARAIDDYTAALAVNPAFYRAHVSRGMEYKAAAQYDRAIADFDQAIATFPRRQTASRERGMSQGAIALYDLYYLRGSAFDEKGESDRAIEDYQQVIALNPQYVEARIRLGISHGKAGSLDEAIEQFSQAIAIDPRSALAYENRGNAYALAGEDAKAVGDYSKVIELDRNNASAYRSRAKLRLKLGDTQAARDDFRMACSLGDRASCDPE